MKIDDVLHSVGITPTPKLSSDGRTRVFKTDCTTDQLVKIAECCPNAKVDISRWNGKTVEMSTWARRGTLYVFKFYAQSEEHAQTVCDDLCAIKFRIDSRQMEFNFMEDWQ